MLSRCSRVLLLAAMAFTLTVAAIGAQRALIVREPGAPASAATTIANMLVARGFSVTQTTAVPANLSDYCCVWDVRPFMDLSTLDLVAYTTHLNDGHGVALIGENTTCCTSRNDSLETAIISLGGGPVNVGGEINGTYNQSANPLNPVNLAPNLVGQVVFNGAGGGFFNNLGNATSLTSSPPGTRASAISFPEGTLSTTPAGRVAVILDINWLIETYASPDNAEFLENVSHFLCPVEDKAFVVDIQTPGNGFIEECPNPIDVTGRVISATPDCVQPTTLTLTQSLPPVIDSLIGPGGQTGDLAGVIGPLPAPVSYPVPTIAFADSLLAVTITDIEVSVNGGPFVAVTSTTPALPAPLPITFTATSLPLVLGANSITIRARDDLGNLRDDTVTGEQRDTLAPVIDPLTCRDQTIDLGPLCRINYNDFPSATDLCDLVLDYVPSPTLPLVITTPSTTPIDYSVSDDSMNSASCSRNVIAVDTTAPALTCPVPLTLECGARLGLPAADPGVQTWINSATASDTCAGATPITNNAPAFFDSACVPGHATTVKFDTRDPSNNPATCTSDLTVADTKAPVISATPPTLTLECNVAGGVLKIDPNVQAWLNQFAAADTCSATTTLRNNAPNLVPSGCTPGLATTVTFEAEDNCSNIASVKQDLTVVDTTPPSLTVPLPLALECNAAGGVPKTDPRVIGWLGTAAASDVCDGATVSNNAPTLLPSGCAPGKATAVDFSAADNCANKATKPSTVTVSDTTAPSLIVPADIVVECSGAGGVPITHPQIQAFLTAATAADICDGATITHDAPAFFPSGCGLGNTVVVTFRAVDNCGNPTLKRARVTVVDTTAPTVVPPAPLTLECNSAGGVPSSDPRIVAWLASASATDVCDGATLSDDAPALFMSGCVPGGVTTVTFSAVDNCGNVGKATSTVTVVDTTPPNVTGLMRPLPPSVSSSPKPPRMPAAPKSVCSPASSRAFVIECQASDVCDPTPTLRAVLKVTNHDVPAPGSCALRVDDVEVACGEEVIVHLVSPPCPARGPRSARAPVAVISGKKVVTGELVVLEVEAADSCGNKAVATYDPTKEPSPLCDEILIDGTCCPAIAFPPDEACEVPLCGRCQPGVTPPPIANSVTASAAACSKDTATALAFADAARFCSGASSPLCGGTCASGGCSEVASARDKKETEVRCDKVMLVGCKDDRGYRCEVNGNVDCGCACR